MGLTINALSETDWNFRSATVPSSWTATNAALSTTLEDYKNESYGSLKAIASSTSFAIKFNESLTSVTAVTDSTFVRDKAEFYVWIRSTVSTVMTPTLTLTRVMETAPTNVDILTTTSSPFNVTSGEWYLIRTQPLTVPTTANQTYRISLNLSFTSSSNATVFVHYPTVYPQLAIIENNFVSDCYRFMPQLFRDNDTETPLPSYPLLRLMEIGMATHGVVFDLATGFHYLDDEGGKDSADPETLSLLADPARTPRDYMFWLSQFTGTRLVNPNAGSTPWANLPNTWQGVDEIDTPTLSAEDAVAWGSLQGFAPEVAGLDDFFEWQVSTGYYGYAAGSLKAVREAAKRVLTDTKTCTITNNYSGSPWRILVQTKVSETPDATSAGQSLDSMLDLMAPARPLGVIIAHQLIN